MAAHVVALTFTARQACYELAERLMRAVVFGKVLEGMDVVRKIEGVPKGPHLRSWRPLTAAGSGDKPRDKVVIAKSGEIPIELEVGEDGAQIPLRACVQLRGRAAHAPREL